MKKVGMLIFSLLLILAQPGFAQAATSGKEELENHWAGSLMNEWLTKGILKGYDNGKVYPDRQVTRRNL